MRPAGYLLWFLLFFALINGGLHLADGSDRARAAASLEQLRDITASLGASDLSLSTEARYTRHPSASDPLAPFMDHPGSLEHFPSGGFFAPAPLHTPQTPRQ